MFPLFLVHLFTDESVVDHEVRSFYLICMQEQVTLVHNLTDKLWRVTERRTTLCSETTIRGLRLGCNSMSGM